MVNEQASNQNDEFGKFATLVALTDKETALGICPQFDSYKVVTGKVGSMELKKVISSVETAAKRGGLIHSDIYRETHALYHAIVEAAEGVTDRKSVV